MARTPVTSTKVERITREGREETKDLVAVEEPLQIILEHGEGHARSETPLAMTMRTPMRRARAGWMWVGTQPTTSWRWAST